MIRGTVVSKSECLEQIEHGYRVYDTVEYKFDSFDKNKYHCHVFPEYSLILITHDGKWYKFFADHTLSLNYSCVVQIDWPLGYDFTVCYKDLPPINVPPQGSLYPLIRSNENYSNYPSILNIANDADMRINQWIQANKHLLGHWK